MPQSTFPENSPLAEDEKALAFTAHLAAVMHKCGATAAQLETIIARIARRLGQEGNFLALPTAFIAAFGQLGRQNTAIVRVDAGSVDLDKLVRFGEVADYVGAGALTPEEGARQLEEIEARPSRYGNFLTLCCAALASGSAAHFFGGGLKEIGASIGIGLVVGLLSFLFARSHRAVQVFEPAAAILASVLAVAAALWFGPLSTSIAILGGLIMLVPGFSVTVAMAELTSRHLICGTGRLMGAFTTFLIIGLGVVIGGKIAFLLKLSAASGFGGTLPAWTESLALLIGLFSLSVIFRAPAEDLLWIFAGGVLSYGAVHLATPVMGSDMCAGAGSLALGLWANFYSLKRRRPATVALVPGLLLLVPGSMGLRSLLLVMEQNVVSGMDGAFQMVMVAISLTTGLLLANILFPVKRSF